MLDYILVRHTYAERISETGCTPIALVPVNAWPASGERVVEGVEYGDNILGVQGHPGADDLLPELFQFLAD